ncbi:MAG: hypothetical protein WBO10_01165 [Pyrinomonadaceae bacterium]
MMTLKHARILTSLCLLILVAVATNAQTSSMSEYEPNEKQPFGKLNPAAPAETKEFAFMIGEFACQEEFFTPQDGKWVKFPAVWAAKYFLNGQGIIDQYWSPTFSTSNIRIFDAKEKNWSVTFFRMPGYAASPVWKGVKEGENMVMRQGDDTKGTRLTFSDITKDSFNWTGASMADGKATPFWTSKCKRSR